MIETKDQSIRLAEQYHFNLYKRFPVTFVKGDGCKLWDVEGKEYLDALAGIAVNCLGYNHPAFVNAVCEQVSKVHHLSNLFYNEPQSKLAEALAKHSGLDKVFFCNSGGEAVEGAIKVARKFGTQKGRKGQIISMENCFHGRTIATIAMGKEKYQKGFEPMPEGFSKIPFNDIEAARKAINDQTVAVIIEVIQGEGGINVADKAFVQELRKLCDETGTLLICDEIQCGMGRTGSMFAYQDYGILPDIVTSAKGLGGGFPIGGVFAKNEVAAVISPGEHGTTYGGNPLACAASLACVETIDSQDLTKSALEKGNYFMEKIKSIGKEIPDIKEIRGKGLMIGVELNYEAAGIVKKMMEKGVIANAIVNTIRIVPPLIISKEELDQVANTLIASIKEAEINKN